MGQIYVIRLITAVSENEQINVYVTIYLNCLTNFHLAFNVLSSLSNFPHCCPLGIKDTYHQSLLNKYADPSFGSLCSLVTVCL